MNVTRHRRGPFGSAWRRRWEVPRIRSLRCSEVDIARTLGLASLEGSHFLDNPASARVLEKLGFEPLGITAPRLSCARGAEVPARLMRLHLACDECDGDEALAA